ncbi:MAG: hypothetical protein ABSA59_12700 [Terriglobia bacterium]|jgi:hypothetical protein
MGKLKLVCFLCLFCISVIGPLQAAEPPGWLNPLKGFSRTSLGAEVEVYSGGITGKSIGAAYDSATRGDGGVRFTFGFMKAFNFSMGYMYSNQTRTLTTAVPASGGLPSGTALMRAGNLNVVFGNGEIGLAKFGRSTWYLSPGMGFARNAGRNMTFVTPLGSASAPILPGTAVSFNLGTGVKIFPWKHVGFRIDARDYVSGGGTGSLSANLNLPPQLAALCTKGCTTFNPAPLFGMVPVQNNIVFTLGLIFKIK